VKVTVRTSVDLPIDLDAWRARERAIAYAEESLTELRAARAQDLHTMKGAGMSIRQIAAVTGLSHTRVGELTKQAKGE
jgi:hypothetical protein